MLFGLAILVGWLEKKDFKIRTSIDLPLFLFLAWVLLTIPFSLDPEYSFEEWRKLLAQCLVFYWAVFVMREISQRQHGERPGLLFKWLEGIRGKTHVPNVFLGVLIGALLISGFSLVDFIEKGGSWQDRNIRAIVPGSDYNWLSTYMVLAMPIVVFCGMAFREVWEKIFSVGIFVFALLAQAASYSRAGWLASVIQIFVWGMVTRRRVLLIGCILGIILGSVALVGIAQMGYQADTLDAWTVKTRIQVWKLGVEQIISHPIVGIGYGNNIFQPVLADSPMGSSPMHLHNTFLMVGVGSGIPGFLLLSWVMIRLAVELFPQSTKKNRTNSENLKLCVGIVLVGFLFRNLFDYMFAGSLAYLFWILMACGIEANERITPNYKNEGLETG